MPLNTLLPWMPHALPSFRVLSSHAGVVPAQRLEDRRAADLERGQGRPAVLADVLEQGGRQRSWAAEEWLRQQEEGAARGSHVLFTCVSVTSGLPLSVTRHAAMRITAPSQYRIDCNFVV